MSAGPRARNSVATTILVLLGVAGCGGARPRTPTRCAEVPRVPPRAPARTAPPPGAGRVEASAPSVALPPPAAPPAALPAPRHVPAPGAPPTSAPPPVPPSVEPPPVASAVPGPPPPPPPAPSPAPPAPPPSAPRVAPPRTFAEALEQLRRDVASGTDADLASHADLLEAIARHEPAAGTQPSLVRVPELEAAAVARHGGRLGFATLTVYLEPGGDAEALRRAYLDFDRVPEFTGKPGTRTLGREPGAVIGKADAIRRTLGFEFGARWTFRSRPVDRGPARLILSSLVPAPDTSHMLFTQGLWLAFPEEAGLRVVEIAVSVLDYAVPPLLAGIAEQTARGEMLRRVAGLRAHWREYVR